MESYFILRSWNKKIRILMQKKFISKFYAHIKNIFEIIKNYYFLNILIEKVAYNKLIQGYF